MMRAFLAFGFVTLALLGACGSDDSDDRDVGAGDAETSTTSPTDGVVVSQGGVETTLNWEPDPLVSGADVVWHAEIANRSDAPITLRFSSGLQFDVALREDGDEVYRWSHDRAFTQALSQRELAPGEAFEVTLDDVLDAPPGDYTLVAESVFEPAAGAKAETRVTVEESQ